MASDRSAFEGLIRVSYHVKPSPLEMDCTKPMAAPTMMHTQVVIEIDLHPAWVLCNPDILITAGNRQYQAVEVTPVTS